MTAEFSNVIFGKSKTRLPEVKIFNFNISHTQILSLKTIHYIDM